MKPYYQDDLVTIYHDDTYETPWRVMGDYIVTDPPYGIGATTANRSRGRGRLATAHDWPLVLGDDEPFDPTPLLWVDVPTVLWGANHYAHRLPGSPSWLVWDKRVDLGSNDSADCELAWTNLGGPARVFRHRWQGMIRDSERGESYHPTQKPVALMRWCLAMLPNDPDACVLDPFMGAGSTLVAAKSLGRRATGIERNLRYCEIAAQRCSQEVLGLDDGTARYVEVEPQPRWDLLKPVNGA